MRVTLIQNKFLIRNIFLWVTQRKVHLILFLASPMAQWVKNPPVMQETQEMLVQPLGWEDTLEKGIGTHSSILAWRIPWIAEPDRLQSVGSQRVRCDWVTNIFNFHYNVKKFNFYVNMFITHNPSNKFQKTHNYHFSHKYKLISSEPMKMVQ